MSTNKKFWFPKTKEKYILKSTLTFKGYYSELKEQIQEIGRTDLMKQVSHGNHEFTIPAGTVIKFTSLYMHGGDEHSVTIGSGIFKRQITGLHINSNNFNGVEFDYYLEAAKPIQNKKTIQWSNWPTFPKIGDTYSVSRGRHDTGEYMDDGTIKFEHGYPGTGLDPRINYNSQSFSVVCNVYVEPNVITVEKFGVSTTDIELIVKHCKYELQFTPRCNDKIVVGEYLSQDAVRNASEKYIETDEYKTYAIKETIKSLNICR